MSITINSMDRGLIAKWLTVPGYLILSLCGASQWVHTLASGRAEGLSLLFLASFAAGLAILQAAFRLARAGLAFEIGNGVGLINALLMLGAWWWVQ